MDNEWYFIGLWLGDGAKDATSITSADKEIIEYMKNLAAKYNLHISIYKTKSKAFELNIRGDNSYTKTVHKYTMSGDYICTYNSIKEAGQENNISSSNISIAAAGRYKHSGGFVWKYGEVVKGNTLRKMLINLNLINNKHIPKEIFNESIHNKKLFLSGIIDSDGTRDYQTIIISQKDLTFIKDLQVLCESLGYKTKIKIDVVKGKEYYKLVLKGDLRDLPLLLNRKLPTKISRFNG